MGSHLVSKDLKMPVLNFGGSFGKTSNFGSRLSSNFGGFSGLGERKCPENWNLYRGSSRRTCYFFNDELMDKVSATKKCRKLGGSLLHFENEEENIFFEKQLSSKKSSSNAWLGINNTARKSNPSRKWVLDSDRNWGMISKPVRYQNWDEDSEEDDLKDSAVFKSSNGRWMLADDDEKNYFFCQKIPSY